METVQGRAAWTKGKLVGQTSPLKRKDIWAIRIHLQNARALRDLAMFNLAIDSKLRGRDLVSLRVRDVTLGNRILPRAMVIQRKNSAVSAIRADQGDLDLQAHKEPEGFTAATGSYQAAKHCPIPRHRGG